MKAVIIEQPGGANEFVEADVKTPDIKSDEVLVEVHAASVNPIDIAIREMKKDMPVEFPAILSSDISGVVVEVGSEVTEFKKGDAVFGRNDMFLGGGFAEYAALNQDSIVKKPEEVSFEEAAALGIAGLTAYQLVHDAGKVQKGDHVFIKGGSGGVGTFAVQFAKLQGAKVTATTSQNEDLLKELGADEVINYEETDPVEEVRDADVLIVTVGEGDTYLKSVKEGGRAVTPVDPIDEEKAKERNITTERIVHELKKDQLSHFAELIAADQLKVIIDEVFPLTSEGVQHAHELSESGHAAGKIIVKVK